jgi:hypothetical protein
VTITLRRRDDYSIYNNSLRRPCDGSRHTHIVKQRHSDHSVDNVRGCASRRLQVTITGFAIAAQTDIDLTTFN